MNEENQKVIAFLKKAKVSSSLNKLAEENLKEFKLKPDDCGGERKLGEIFADSNLGGTGDGRMIDNCGADGVDPSDEIDAWRNVFRAAQSLAEKLEVAPTNRNLMLLSHHPKAEKAWKDSCK